MSAICDCPPLLSKMGEQNHLQLLDYYDGPVSGVLTCSQCNKYYSFDMLDWTADHRYRLFMLYTIDAAEYERYTGLLETSTTNPSDEGSSSYELLKAIVHPHPKPDKLAVWDNAKGLLLAEYPVPSEDNSIIWDTWMNSNSNTNWFESLNIALPPQTLQRVIKQ